VKFSADLLSARPAGWWVPFRLEVRACRADL